MPLSGKVALVTGVGDPTGIGCAVARRLRRDGAHVVITDLPGLDLGPSAELVGGGALCLPADVRDEDQVSALVDRIKSEYGRLDILVNNAQTCLPQPVAEVTRDDWQAQMDVIALGTFLLSKAVAPVMSSNGGGRMINIASVNGWTGAPFLSIYSAAQFAVVSITQSLAYELACHGVLVNAVTPGHIETEGFATVHRRLAEIKGDTPEAGQAPVASIPAGRLGQPDDVAGAVAFLASDAASYLTGQSLHLNGGLLMR